MVTREKLEAGANVLVEAPETLESWGEDAAAIAEALPQVTQLLEGFDADLLDLGEAVPLVAVGAKLLKIYLKVTKAEPTLANSVAVVAQLAYGQALQRDLKQITDPQLRQGLKSLNLNRLCQLQADRLQTVTDAEAKAAVGSLHGSRLGEQLAAVLVEQLQAAEVPEAVAKDWGDRLLRLAQPHWLEAVSTAGETVQPLADLYRLGGRETLERYQSLERYLEEVIAPKPQEKVFGESFTFQDIYVPLLAQPLRSDGEVNRSKSPIALEEWVLESLADEQQKNQVLFIQGGPGRGKSVFCRMMADRLRRQEYPRWVPILIRLRDLTVLEKDFEETLRKGVDRDFAQTDAGWLTDRSIRYLFLLDGFDELLMEGRTSGGLEQFLGQVGRFQESCGRNSEKQHRVLITGRTMALHSIERTMPSNLRRVAIEPLNDTQISQWFQQWDQIQQQDPQTLQTPGQNSPLADSVQELIREPLLLYLFAAMHRDGELEAGIFEGTNAAEAKVLIYEKTLHWVLTQQRAEGLNQQITALDTENLRHILQEAGLAVWQSGRECASLAMIQSRLQQDAGAKAFLDQAQQRLGENPLNNALAVFYLKPGQGEGSVEFVHKSFGEFLCAERLAEALADWAEPGQRRQPFYIPDEAMHWQVYDLLAGQMLTVEVMDSLRVLWFRDAEPENLVRLFDRLHQFYDRWCEGEFLDMAPGENLPQRKMMQLRELGLTLGLRQVDLYTGLNVMILLLELHRYGQNHDSLKDSLHFYPSGQPVGNDRTQRLWKVIAYGDSLNPSTFAIHMRLFLSGADLSSANLSRANLSRANLSSADLSRANLSSADLSRANLRGAYLSSANLSGANLSDADLSRANLRGANLSGANLSNANLSSANLSSANLSSANLRGANLSHANLSGADLRGADLRGANLRGANLSSANLSSANLSSANLSRAYLSGAYLSSANLSGANLSSANLSSANLSSANLSSANLRGANLSGADLSHANLSGANLRGADLRGANLSHANLSGANLRGADLSGADLSGANLSGANLSGANLRGADLSGANLSGANLRGADLSSAKLRDRHWGLVRWDEGTKWEGVKGLETATGVPAALRQQLGLPESQ
ncbi:hypothetical protein PROH_10420 [Prochlorothrix hollandica PCC 9006 = CALU 1027]|uniref:Uncharacterized protein n=2 Tax=Prochlorothrix hollandica TaxID=1223 RepID=A0A0M2Q0S9_PROHO|nr:hypothetical protein PROH_10420 [Prochlorothrix hollandica PCC 9006 = CALU 1027]